MEDWLKADLQDAYGLTVTAAEPVAGGWMNCKWRVFASDGDWLVKMFSRARYRRQAQLDAIAAALERQMALHAAGIPCPELRTCGGRPLRVLEDGRAYTVMRFCTGQVLDSETVTLRQLRSLGGVRGEMQRVFDWLPTEGAKGYPFNAVAALAQLRAYCDAREVELTAEMPADYAAVIRAQRPILDTITPQWLAAQPMGLAHEDFSPDNMLFDDKGVSAVLDFDRSQYGFVRHDLARALLSFALRGNALDAGAAVALFDGYAGYHRLTAREAADALRVAWVVEAPWWINLNGYAAESSKVRRFYRELCWVSENWFGLDQIWENIEF